MRFTRLYKPILKILFLICPLILFSQNPYITVWQTDIETTSTEPFTTTDNEILVPAEGEFTYTWVEVDNSENTGTGTGEDETVISFPEPGTYELSITPTGENPFHRIKFGGLSIDREKLLKVSQWGDVEWSSFKQAYKKARNLEVTASDTPHLLGVTDMSEAFSYVSGIEPINNLNEWDMSMVTDMSKMFFLSADFNQDVGNWDVSKVENMFGMFSLTDFNKSIENWDVSSVNNMAEMFAVSPFNKALSNWDVSSVTNMSGLFSMTNFNQPIGNWNVSQVTDMSFMFYENGNFNHELNTWNVENVENMENMFFNAFSFNQPLENWDVSNVINMTSMFQTFDPMTHPQNSATSLESDFNQPLNSWDVSQVKLMTDMFSGATSFDHPLNEWNLGSIEIITGIFSESGISCKNASISLKGWAENPNTNTDVYAYNINVDYSPDIQEEVDYLIDDLNWNISGAILGTCTLGLEDHQLSQFNFYPNPAKAIINFETTQAVREIMIYNLIGQEVLFVAHPANHLDVSQLNPGMYMMSVEFDNDQRQIMKLIKK